MLAIFAMSFVICPPPVTTSLNFTQSNATPVYILHREGTADNSLGIKAEVEEGHPFIAFTTL
jgi:hypothetical protein